MNVERINSAIENYLNQESFDFDWNIIDEETENEKEYFAVRHADTYHNRLWEFRGTSKSERVII